MVQIRLASDSLYHKLTASIKKATAMFLLRWYRTSNVAVSLLKLFNRRLFHIKCTQDISGLGFSSISGVIRQSATWCHHQLQHLYYEEQMLLILPYTPHIFILYVELPNAYSMFLFRYDRVAKLLIYHSKPRWWDSIISSSVEGAWYTTAKEPGLSSMSLDESIISTCLLKRLLEEILPIVISSPSAWSPLGVRAMFTNNMRRMGMDAAMMVMAPSALPQITRIAL